MQAADAKVRRDGNFVSRPRARRGSDVGDIAAAGIKKVTSPPSEEGHVKRNIKNAHRGRCAGSRSRSAHVYDWATLDANAK